MFSSQNLGVQTQFPPNFGKDHILTRRNLGIGLLGNPDMQPQKVPTSTLSPVLRQLQQDTPKRQDNVLFTRAEARGWLLESQAKPKPLDSPYKDRTSDYDWLHLHRDEYANQWVALNDGRLISHGIELKEVIAEARHLGEPDALMIFVEPSTAPPFLMLWS